MYLQVKIVADPFFGWKNNHFEKDEQIRRGKQMMNIFGNETSKFTRSLKRIEKFSKTTKNF